MILLIPCVQQISVHVSDTCSNMDRICDVKHMKTLHAAYTCIKLLTHGMEIKT